MSEMNITPPPGRRIDGVYQDDGKEGWTAGKGIAFQACRLPGPMGWYEAVQVFKNDALVALVPAHLCVITYGEEADDGR